MSDRDYRTMKKETENIAMNKNKNNIGFYNVIKWNFGKIKSVFSKKVALNSNEIFEEYLVLQRRKIECLKKNIG